METHYDRIEKKPDVMLGKPVIKGTRIPVELIIRKLGEGASFKDLLDAYPTLNREDIQAALIYAAEFSFFNPETEGVLPISIYLSESVDDGLTWSIPEKMDVGEFDSTPIPLMGPISRVSDHELICPFETTFVVTQLLSSPTPPKTKYPPFSFFFFL